MKKFKRLYLYLWAVLLVSADQIVKLIVVKKENQLPVQVIKKFLKFTYCENRGVAFSLGDGNVTLFIIINIVLISLLIAFFEINRNKFNIFGKTCIALTIAGGFSNLIDRIARGYVVDFIDVSDFIDFAVFNVADIFITCGVIGLAIYYIYNSVKNGDSKNEKDNG